MNNYIRWYDNDPDLKHLMAFIENLNEETREHIAQDLIQIILAEIETDKDAELYQLTQNNIGQYRRWYDSNIILHSAIEIIKNLDESKRKEIIHLIMESIIQILVDINNE